MLLSQRGYLETYIITDSIKCYHEESFKQGCYFRMRRCFCRNVGTLKHIPLLIQSSVIMKNLSNKTVTFECGEAYPPYAGRMAVMRHFF